MRPFEGDLGGEPLLQQAPLSLQIQARRTRRLLSRLEGRLHRALLRREALHELGIDVHNVDDGVALADVAAVPDVPARQAPGGQAGERLAALRRV